MEGSFLFVLTIILLFTAGLVGFTSAYV